MKKLTLIFLLSLIVAGCDDGYSLSLEEQCETGERVCLDNDVARCAPNGTWEFILECGEAGCKEGQCIGHVDGDEDDDLFDSDNDKDDVLLETEYSEAHEESEILDNTEISSELAGEADTVEDIGEEIEIDISDNESEVTDSAEENIDVETRQCLDDEFAGLNNSEQTAHVTTLPVSYQGLGLCPWAEQWFSFNLPEQSGFKAIIWYDPILGPLDMKLYVSGHNGLTDYVGSTRERVNGAELVYNQASMGLYFLRIHGRGDEQWFNLDLETSVAGYGNGNDLCDQAITITRNQLITGTTNHSHDDYQGSCSESHGPEVVYAFSPLLPIRATVVFTPEAFDGVVYIRSECEHQETESGCADEVATGVEERIALDVEAFKTYYIIVDGRRWEDQGVFTLKVE